MVNFGCGFLLVKTKYQDEVEKRDKKRNRLENKTKSPPQRSLLDDFRKESSLPNHQVKTNLSKSIFFLFYSEFIKITYFQNSNETSFSNILTDKRVISSKPVIDETPSISNKYEQEAMRTIWDIQENEIDGGAEVKR